MFFSLDEFRELINLLQNQAKLENAVYKSSERNICMFKLNDNLYKVINILFCSKIPKLMYDELIMWWLYENGRELKHKDKLVKLDTVEDLYIYCISNLTKYHELNRGLN